MPESIERYESADHCFLDDGVALQDLANRAVELFEKQPPREKHRLLNFVLSNCSWHDGELTPGFRQPLDMIAVASSEQAQKKAAGDASSDLCQLRGPWIDTFITFLLDPSFEARQILQQCRAWVQD